MTIVTLPGDGIGPEVLAAALQRARRGRRRPHLRGAPVRRRRDRRHRHRADRRDARRRARAPTPSCSPRSAARSGTRPTRTAAPRAGPARPAPGPRPVRQPAPGPPAAGALRRQPAQARGDRAHRPARRARAHRRHLLRREGPRRRPRARRLRLHRATRSSGSPASPSRPRARASPASTRPTCSRPRGCGARSSRACTRAEFPNIELEHLLVDNAAMQLVAAPAPLRRDPHREHVRRHPQRRGGDAHRLDRAAAERRRSARDGTRACSSPCTARRPTSPARASPTRWR